MNIYVDENQTSRKLAGLLQRSGRRVWQPGPYGLSGASDAAPLTFAIQTSLVFLTNDRDDFQDLHKLVIASGGNHPGILFIANEQDARKNMKPHHIVKAIAKLEKAGIDLDNQVITLNQWR